MFRIQFNQDRINDDEYFTVLLTFKDVTTNGDYTITIDLDGDYIYKFSNYKKELPVVFDFDGVNISVKKDDISIFVYTNSGSVEYKQMYTQKAIDSLFACLDEWIELYSKTYKNFYRENDI